MFAIRKDGDELVVDIYEVSTGAFDSPKAKKILPKIKWPKINLIKYRDEPVPVEDIK